MAYEQPELDYEYDGLEPHIDSLTMETHYSKHHAGYCKKYNKAVEGTKLEVVDLKEVLSDLDSIPEDIKSSVVNNGGGAWNHSFFWSVMAPENETGQMSDGLQSAIEESFGGIEEFKENFKDAAATVFGSGWAWLVVNGEGKLEIVKTQNQESPISKGLKPILCLDVWEHAYYLKYKNLRPDYIEAFFNVVNWKKVSEYYSNTTK